MASTPRSVTQGFFKGYSPAASVSQQDKAPVLVDMGGIGDCGFRAIAAGLIDNFLSNPRFKGDLLSNLLTRHFVYFPLHRPTAPGLVTPAERMQQVIRHVNMPELVRALAYTVRQMTVDEICAHPELYRGVFADVHEQTNPEQMRKPTTWIDESAMSAAAKILAVPIKVKVVKQGKELPMRLVYSEEAVNPAITLQLQGKHYIPYVSHRERFTSVKTQPVRAFQPIVSDVVKDPDLPAILRIIAEEDKRILAEYESILHRLTAMVVAGELNKDDLLAIYVAGMRSSDYLQGRVKYVGTEHGSQNFFEAIVQAQQGVKTVSISEDHYEEQVTQALVQGIARAISIGHMNALDVFAQIDSKEEQRTARALG